MKQISTVEIQAENSFVESAFIPYWEKHPRRIKRFRRKVIRAAVCLDPGDTFRLEVPLRSLLPLHLRIRYRIVIFRYKKDARIRFIEMSNLDMADYLEEKTMEIGSVISYVNAAMRLALRFKVP